jgi:hypothetical protein
VDFHFKHNITVVNYALLGNTSPIYATAGASAPKLITNKVIVDIEKARGCALAQVVLAWNMRRKISPCSKAIRKDHPVEIDNYLEKCRLEAEDVAKIQAMPYKIRRERFALLRFELKISSATDDRINSSYTERMTGTHLHFIILDRVALYLRFRVITRSPRLSFVAVPWYATDISGKQSQ